jgi:ABC-2 type transport system ATP-binding protein
MIKLTNINKHYGKIKALTDINIEFKPNKVYGIIGHNGAGKTTLFRCINRLTSFQGSLEIDDEILNSIGYLPTEPEIMSFITGHEYLQLLCNARGIEYKRKGNLSNVFELPLERYASTYSTGMKKKLALTGLLLQKNKVFILDEPFNGVDVESNQLIIEIIKVLKEMGKLIIISSHILSSLRDICDSYLVIKEGIIQKHYDKEEFLLQENSIFKADVKEKIKNLL